MVSRSIGAASCCAPRCCADSAGRCVMRCWNQPARQPSWRTSKGRTSFSPLWTTHGTGIRYHQLFAELLRVQLQYIEPELITTLHQRAATWFTTQGFTDDAVHHLSAAGDTTGLANLVAAQSAAEFNQGRLSTISGWIDLLPYESVSADPRLSCAPVRPRPRVTAHSGRSRE